MSVIPGTRDTLLKNVSFSLEPGEVLCIIGPSGSGKTTLARHIVGASIPSSGAVRLDGTEMHHWQPEQFGEHIGYLPQDVKLFGGSVGENISRFQEEPQDSDIVAAAQLAGAHEMVQNFPNGYGTKVGDGGNLLSGGQRQRVGLARAVYKNPCLIVLDEPNSNLDNYGEQALTDCILELKKRGATVVLVTHKKNLLALSDKTLMLVNGVVEKFGPTAELFAAPAAAEGQKPAAKKMSVVQGLSTAPTKGA